MYSKKLTKSNIPTQPSCMFLVTMAQQQLLRPKSRPRPSAALLCCWEERAQANLVSKGGSNKKGKYLDLPPPKADLPPPRHRRRKVSNNCYGQKVVLAPRCLSLLRCWEAGTRANWFNKGGYIEKSKYLDLPPPKLALPPPSPPPPIKMLALCCCGRNSFQPLLSLLWCLGNVWMVRWRMWV